MTGAEQGSTESAEAPVVVELRANGYPISSVQDLYQKRFDYRAAIPILVKWLPRVSDNATKEQIVRALSVRWARPAAAKPLVEEFRHTTDERWLGLRWTIGNALSVVADEAVFDDLVELLNNKKYGRSREMLALALANTKRERAVDVLIACLEDPDVAGHAVAALGKLKAKEAEHQLQRFLTHPKAWIRREARKALERLAKAPARRSDRG